MSEAAAFPLEQTIGTPRNLNALFAAVNEIDRDLQTAADSVRVAFVRNVTIEGIDAYLKVHLHAARIRPVTDFSGYGDPVQEILSPDGVIARATPDLIVTALSLDELDPAYGNPGWRADGVKAQLTAMFELLEARTKATIAVNTFLLPLHSELGIALAPDGSDRISQIEELNRFVAAYARARTPRFVVTDWNRYVRLAGADACLDERCRYLWKAPFKKAFLDLYGRDIARIARALQGKAKKCVVVDCDNTLWGGIVGEDGLDGIKLDPAGYPGKAFHDFQATLLHLAERGVLVVLCSKNEEGDVFEVLDTHPSCRLKRAHLAAWRINWRDKATNIADLADELNLGLDAFVFVDDNPAECDLVRRALPEVTVLQVPEKLYELPLLLLRDGLFDSLNVTGEDKNRARLYQSEAQRKSTRENFTNIAEYLTSLETVATIHRIRATEVPRIAQLTQRTNQFNLTTRRYSEADIRALKESGDTAVFTLSVADRFGDLGLVGVLIARRDGAEARVDTFLLSCRVLGRGLERAMIVHCLRSAAADWRIARWTAEYIATRKNGQTADFWRSVGFRRASGDDKHATYALDMSAPDFGAPTHIVIRED